jgi:hypothetical protein
LSLRLAFDLDGVLADMESELVRQATALFGDSVARPPRARARRAAAHHGPVPPESAAALRLTLRQEHQLWRHVSGIDDFWESLREIEPGSVARLAALARERRWEVIFLTQRPDTAGATSQLQTQRWLEAKGFALPSVFVVKGSRGRVAAALGLDLVVDDLPENCVDVTADSHARAVLVWRDRTMDVPVTAKRPGVLVVKSVAECLAGLSDIGLPGRARSGLVGRLVRRLGFGKPARA